MVSAQSPHLLSTTRKRPFKSGNKLRISGGSGGERSRGKDKAVGGRSPKGNDTEKKEKGNNHFLSMKGWSKDHAPDGWFREQPSRQQTIPQMKFLFFGGRSKKCRPIWFHQLMFWGG